MRWGTNHITAYVPGGIGFTEAFFTTFDEAQPDHEAQSTVGDSGGGVFAKDGPDWKLAGIMIALGNFPPQTLMTALYGNVTYSADVSAYSDQIVDAIAVPEPAWLLQIGAGLGFLATVGRRRMRP